jgi:DNA-binding GntR family transcriptional regulator
VHRAAIHRAEHVDGEGADPLAPTSLTDEIVFRLENAILEGVYPPGTRLRQDELCVRFGVSRTPVREALRTLQARNLVVVMPNRGATVRIPSRKDAAELYDVRAELEGYACEREHRGTEAEMAER